LPAPARLLPLLPTANSTASTPLPPRCALAGRALTAARVGLFFQQPGSAWLYDNRDEPGYCMKRPKAGGLRPQHWLHRRVSMATQGICLRDFDSRASSFQVLLHLLGVFLRSAFLQDATGFGQVLRFLQAQAGDGADGLDHFDLLVARRLQDDGEQDLHFYGSIRARYS